jgi:hypothetical protein
MPMTELRFLDVKITGTATVTWPEPKREHDEQAQPEQVEAVNEQEQEN